VVLAKSAGDSKSQGGRGGSEIGRAEKIPNADSDLDPHPRWRLALAVL
jgi:hypothetical protein